MVRTAVHIIMTQKKQPCRDFQPPLKVWNQRKRLMLVAFDKNVVLMQTKSEILWPGTTHKGQILGREIGLPAAYMQAKTNDKKQVCEYTELVRPCNAFTNCNVQRGPQLASHWTLSLHVCYIIQNNVNDYCKLWLFTPKMKTGSKFLKQNFFPLF